jgi:histidinol-phosphate phosphatase family protein
MAQEIKQSITQAVILAGGRGTRLKPITDTIPKPLVPIHGRPFLEYLIELLRGNGITDVLLLLGYLPEKITAHFGDGKKFGVHITYSITDVDDDTGTRLKKAEALLDDHFLLMYCDNYWPLNLARLSAFYENKNMPASVVVFSNKNQMTKNNMFVNEYGHVATYDKSRLATGLNGVDAGFFLMDKKVLALAPEGVFSFEKEIVAQLVANKQLAGYMTDHRYYSLGSIERLPVTEAFFKPKKVIFLDRDGVINKKPPKADYVKRWKEFEFLPGALEGLELLSKAGYDLYVITNQPGIARGLMSREDLDAVHANMQQKMGERGIALRGIYACLHGWDEGCDCRKPKPGLLYQAANENYFDATKATFIGDDSRDIDAGEAVGCRTILAKEGDLPSVVQSLIRES